jgi:hypothetical protein
MPFTVTAFWQMGVPWAKEDLGVYISRRILGSVQQGNGRLVQTSFELGKSEKGGAAIT